METQIQMMDVQTHAKLNLGTFAQELFVFLSVETELLLALKLVMMLIKLILTVVQVLAILSNITNVQVKDQEAVNRNAGMDIESDTRHVTMEISSQMTDVIHPVLFKEAIIAKESNLCAHLNVEIQYLLRTNVRI